MSQVTILNDSITEFLNSGHHLFGMPYNEQSHEICSPECSILSSKCFRTEVGNSVKPLWIYICPLTWDVVSLGNVILFLTQLCHDITCCFDTLRLSVSILTIYFMVWQFWYETIFLSDQKKKYLSERWISEQCSNWYNVRIGAFHLLPVISPFLPLPVLPFHCLSCRFLFHFISSLHLLSGSTK